MWHGPWAMRDIVHNAAIEVVRRHVSVNASEMTRTVHRGHLVCRERNAGTSFAFSLCMEKNPTELCQNCVSYPPKPWGNTVTYGDTLKQIVVAVSR
jgi:hypothetical protein